MECNSTTVKNLANGLISNDINLSHDSMKQEAQCL